MSTDRAIAVAGAVVLLAIVIVAVSRPPETVRLGVSPSPTPSASGDSLADVPDECRGDVVGAPFARGDVSERVQLMAAWLDQHPGGSASLVLTDDVLTREAAKSKQSVTTEDTRVEIVDEGFRLSSTVVFFGRYPISALLVPTIDDGDVRFDVRDLDTDGMPGFMRPAVEQSLAASADPATWGLDVRIDDLLTRRGCAVAVASR